MLRRQLIVLDWFFGRFHAHLDPENIIRYEDVVESGGLALFRRLGHADARPAALKSRNDSTLYDDVIIDTLLAALLDSRGRWTQFYSAGDCERVADEIRRGRLKQRRRTGSERGANGQSTVAQGTALPCEDGLASLTTSSKGCSSNSARTRQATVG